MMVRCFKFVVLVSFLCPCLKGESTFKELDDSYCGNIFTEKTFILTSENYPSPYPSNKECFYLLKGPNCTIQFNIEFLDFDVKTSIGCTKDRLEIGHQDALCGPTKGSKVYSAGNGSLKLKFVSDNEHEKNRRGFKVLVNRIDVCTPDNPSSEGNKTFESRGILETDTEATQAEWTSKKTNLRPNDIAPVTKQCCQNNIFASKNLLLVSPNFPYSGNTPSDCIYIIKKASSQVCRLRINILFFHLGPPTENSCPYGHLEIDGKYICGCNSDLKLTSEFRDLDSKVLSYHSSGYNTNGFYGFVLEVVQDECPTKYSPDDGVRERRSSGNFRFYNDQFNKVSWPQPGNRNIQQLKLVKERTHLFPAENNGLESQFGNIYKHFYFFAPQDEKDISWTHHDQEREETNYIEISTINTLLTNLYNYKQCVMWNGNQVVLLNGRFGNSLYQMCKSFQQNNIDGINCLVLSAVKGNIRSPGYPLIYPASQKLCYRFQMLPGYCAVTLFLNDFQIEKSYDCLKDYLEINQHRYCGNYLQNKQVTINTQGKSHQDLNFITDANYCGKGFSATYQQVPCQKPDYPITPLNCKPSMETTEIPANCYKIISENYFVIKDKTRANVCTFTIKKFSWDVCKIQLHFERFNLPCESESITIDGQIFCGQMSGRTLTVDILDEKRIVFRRNSLNPTADDFSDYIIQGIQIRDDCEANVPDPVRLTLASSKNQVSSADKWNKKIYLNYYADICNLVKNNATFKDFPNKICQFLTDTHNISDCTILKADDLDLSTKDINTTKIRLSSKLAEEEKYEVIECQL